VLFKQLFETHPRIIEDSEAAYTVAMLQEMFYQIDYNGDGECLTDYNGYRWLRAVCPLCIRRSTAPCCEETLPLTTRVAVLRCTSSRDNSANTDIGSLF
jgi:hypothetical protein